MAQRYDFSLDLGSDEDVLIQYAPNNIPTDLVGWEVEANLARKYGETSVLTLSTANSGITVNDSLLTLKFRYASFAGLSGRYQYDVFATNSSLNLRRKIVQGEITFNPAVTQTT